MRILGRTRDWLRYDVPDQWLRRDWRGNYRGQKQIWFLLRLVGRDCDVSLRASRQAGVRRLALERLLGADGIGDRLQARGLPEGAEELARYLAAPRASAGARRGSAESAGSELTRG